MSVLKRLFRRQDGTAAVEMGIIFPLFVTLIAGISGYGLAIVEMMQVANAAQAGTQYAAANGCASSSCTAAISAAVGSAAGMGAISLSSGYPTYLVTTSSGVACTGCAAGTYVTVQAEAAYVPSSLGALLPGIPSKLTAAIMVRTQ